MLKSKEAAGGRGALAFWAEIWYTDANFRYAGGDRRAHTRRASKKAARKAQAEAESRARTSRLQFTEEERATPELQPYIKKSDKAADRLDKARAKIPKEKKLVKERTFDEATGKGKTRLQKVTEFLMPLLPCL